MASNLKYGTTAKAAQENALSTTAGPGATWTLYNGLQPASPDIAIGTQVVLVALVCGTPFAATTTTGVLTMNAIASGTGTAAAGTGTAATWYRIASSTGVGIIDGTVGTSGCDLNMANVSIASGQPVTINSSTYTNAN